MTEQVSVHTHTHTLISKPQFAQGEECTDINLLQLFIYVPETRDPGMKREESFACTPNHNRTESY